MDISSHQHVCLPASASVFEFRVDLLYVLVSVSRVWDVDYLQSELLFSTVTPVILDPECCTFLMYLLPSLVDETARHVRPSRLSTVFFLLRSPGLVERDRVPVFVSELVQLLDELVDPVVGFQRARVFWTIVIAIVSWFLLLSHRVPGGWKEGRVLSLLVVVAVWS